MNTPEAVNRGFADFSKVSLAWNKLVARVNPYIKGQQQAPEFQAATAGDYNYVRQKLKDDLLQFFSNGIQQINDWKRNVGGVPTVQNEATIVDIAQQLGTGFYKNVKYGAEVRTSLFIPRLPPNAGQPPPPAPAPAGQPPFPPNQPAPLIQPPAQQPQIGQADIRLFDDYDQIHGQATPITLQNAAMVAQTIENDMFNALPQQRQRQVTPQQRDGERQRIEALVPEMVLYIQLQQYQQQQQQQQQQGQQQPPPQQQQGQLTQDDIDDFEDWEQANGNIDAQNADQAAAEIEDARFNEYVAQLGVNQPPPDQQARDAVEAAIRQLIPDYIQYTRRTATSTTATARATSGAIASTIKTWSSSTRPDGDCCENR